MCDWCTFWAQNNVWLIMTNVLLSSFKTREGDTPESVYVKICRYIFKGVQMKKPIMIALVVCLSGCTTVDRSTLDADQSGDTQEQIQNQITPISPDEMVRRMGVGVDATWSEVPKKIASYTSEATEAFAQKGFKHIRLRVAEDNASKMWSYLDREIRDALDNGMIPIIANQSATFEEDPTPENQAAWVAWWGEVARHYKDAPYELMFDLIVEIAARSSLSEEPINQLNMAYEQAVHAIRSGGGHSDKRIIIFSAHKRSDPNKMEMLKIPSEGNGYLIGEFHEGYASGPSKEMESPHYYMDGTTAAELESIEQRVKAAVAWSEKTGIPVWEGAWMPGNYNKGDDYSIAEQKQFAKDFVGVLKRYQIPHAVNATKKFYDIETKSWNEKEEVVDYILSL